MHSATGLKVGCFWRVGVYEAFQKLGVPFWGGPYNKDYSVFGSLYIQGNYHMEFF